VNVFPSNSISGQNFRFKEKMLGSIDKQRPNWSNWAHAAWNTTHGHAPCCCISIAAVVN